MIDFETKLTARQIRTAAAEADLGWTELEVGAIDREDAHFTVTDSEGRKFRVTVTPES